MWRRFSNTLLWVVCGIVLWHCAHSITLVFPLPGPWLPTQVAWVTGVIMGCLGRILSGGYLGRLSWSSRRLFCILGLVSGTYLGWVSARGALTQQEDFLPPSATDHVLSALVCGGLGMAANCGMSWLLEQTGDRPFRVLYFLLFLLLLMFAAVSLLVISRKEISIWP